MARKIKREDEAVAPVQGVGEAVAAPVATETHTASKAKSFTVSFGITSGTRTAVASVRTASGFVFWNDGVQIRRQPIDKSRPVVITISQ